MKIPVYMDNHATTPVDPRVVEAMLPYFAEHFGNAASHQHRFGWVAEQAVEIARGTIASAINAEPREIVFTSGATESNNLALKGICEALRSRGDRVITAQTEHKSVLDVCKKLESIGFHVTYLPVDTYGMVNPEDVERAVTEKTILVSIMAANNEIGTIAQLSHIGKICGKRDVTFHTDATQAVGKIPVDVRGLNIHLMSLSAHKTYGPKGIGALYVRRKNPRVKIVEQTQGGGHEGGTRSGTLNVPAIVGFGKAIQIAVDEMANESARVGHLRDRLSEALLEIEGSSINGHRTDRLVQNLNITFEGVDADALMGAMKDVAISSGSACTTADRESGKISHVLKAIGLTDESARCSVRFGLGRFTTEEEVEYVGRRVTEVVTRLRKESPKYRMSKSEVPLYSGHPL